MTAQNTHRNWYTRTTTASRSDPNGTDQAGNRGMKEGIRGSANVPPELLDGVEGVGLFEGGAPRSAGLGLRLDVVPEGPLPVQLVRTLRLRSGSALGRRRLGGRRRDRRSWNLDLRHVAPPPLFEVFFWVVGETIPDEGERFAAVEET